MRINENIFSSSFVQDCSFLCDEASASFKKGPQYGELFNVSNHDELIAGKLTTNSWFGM